MWRRLHAAKECLNQGSSWALGWVSVLEELLETHQLGTSMQVFQRGTRGGHS